MNKLLLIDGNSLINRAYYAFGSAGGLTWNGAPTNATYGFLNMFLKSVTDETPTHVAVAFDMRTKTFRHKLYDGYKAARKGMPDELAVQLADLKELLRKMKIAVIEKEGFEADDIIGTLTKTEGEDLKKIILTADRDGLQLVSETTELHLTKTGVTNLEVWDKSKINTEYNLTSAQLIDLKALMGDKSDNIPGAQGVGEKTALTLMQEYGSLENIYSSLPKIKETLREKLTASKELVFLSRTLAAIDTQMDINTNLTDFKFKFPFEKAVYDAFEERGFKSLCKRPSLWEKDFYSAEPAAKEEESQPPAAVTVIEIRSETELCNLIPKLLAEDFVAVTWDDDAVYLASDYSAEYKVFKLKDLLSGGFDSDTLFKTLAPFLESNVKKAVWDSKQLKEKLSVSIGGQIKNVVLDVKLADHLLCTTTNFTAVQDVFKRYKNAGEGGAAPVLRIDFLSKLTAKNMLPLYQDIELPLVDVLLEMQQTGVKIDLVTLQKVSDDLKAQIAGVSSRIFDFAGEQFNINSPQQLGAILFKKLGIQSAEKTKTGLSTNESVLHKAAKQHPIVPEILRYRKIFKLFSTYIQGLKNVSTENGFVHSTFHQTQTVTGRLSSSEPNVQNIPARSEEARLIRQLFISRFKEGKILAADYSQIELRLLAHFSGDEIMINAFKSGRDIHAETAAKIFGVDASSVVPEMRRQAKAVNFGIVYGISAFGLSESIGCSVSDAARFIEKYFEQFPKVKNFLDKCRDTAIAKGYAQTLLGRRRMLPELSSQNQNTVQFGVRAAMNMPMQGSASDIIKKAMIEISKTMHQKSLTSKMTAQIHDELIFDCPENEIKLMTGLVKNIMENIVPLTVPLTVDVEVKDTF